MLVYNCRETDFSSADAMMTTPIRCSNCHKPYPEDQTPHVCTCGGVYDFESFPMFDSSRIHPEQPGMWKYKEMFGLPSNAPLVTLGEGGTPLLSGTINDQPVFFKMESQNPTGSFKDRGSAILVSFLLSRGVREAVEDSSGNAGASFAAYAAKVAMKATIYAPESTSGPKRTQIEAYGAHLMRIPGPRAEAARAVLQAVAHGNVYASHAYMPFGLAGYATIAYEIFDSMKIAPGTVIAPAGHGGLLYGLMLGFEALLNSGEISRLPFFIGVQPENCAPMTAAYRRGGMVDKDLIILPTLAEGASVAAPLRAAPILARMLSGGGKMLSASEKEIGETYHLLAKKGIYCEPTSSLSIIPLLNDKIDINGPVVCVMTGSGYKTNSIP